MKRIILVIILLLLLFPLIAYAHPGRTDSNGGHYNRSTGEYHYHNGRSSSSSSNILPSNCPNCKEKVNPENGYYCFDCGYELVNQSNTLFVVDGPANKTRSEYFNEVQRMQDRLDVLDAKYKNVANQLTQVNEQLSKANVNSIDELIENNSKKNTIIIWLGVFLCISAFCCIKFIIFDNSNTTNSKQQ